MTSPRTVWLVRHGERVDNVDSDWRMTAPRGAWDDPTLTSRGLRQAREVGVRLAEDENSIDHIISSPFTRCIETSQELLKAAGQHGKLRLKVEPGLSESLNVTQWPTLGCHEIDELTALFPGLVDAEYEPVMEKHELCQEENNFACLSRIQQTLDQLLERYEGNLVIVSHGAPIAAAHWLLTGEVKYVGQCTLCKYRLSEQPEAVRDLDIDNSNEALEIFAKGKTKGESPTPSVGALDRMKVKCLRANDSSHLSDTGNLRDKCSELGQLRRLAALTH